MKCSCTTSTSFPLPSFTIFWVVIISYTADSRLKSSTIKYRRGCRCGPLVCHWLNCQTADKTTGQTVGHTNRNPKRHALAKYWHSAVRPARALAATNRAEIIRKRSITSIQITKRKVRTNSRPTHLLSCANGLTREKKLKKQTGFVCLAPKISRRQTRSQDNVTWLNKYGAPWRPSA